MFGGASIAAVGFVNGGWSGASQKSKRMTGDNCWWDWKSPLTGMAHLQARCGTGVNRASSPAVEAM